MGCSCGSTKNGTVSGCRNNGACNTGGCNKMNVFDWLSNMEMPQEDKFNIAEVRFKNGRKEFFSNPDKLNLTTGDAVVTEVQSGHHIGYVSMQGELVRLQMQKKKISIDGDIKKIYRIAHQKDLDKFEEVKKRELPTLYRTREIIRDLKLDMKLSDIEYQADNAKATFFYSADDRVDFRELIKFLASEFRIRVEMRQISLRQEAGRLGGIGVCGRELCCSTWLSDFKNVATSAARYQNLSLNPSKLSGQCGRLKCCLNYELETYMEALEHIPKIEGPLLTEKGEATLQKTDIFRKIMWFGFVSENTWYPLNIDRVNQILLMNREGRKPATLDADVEAEKIPVETLNSDLARMDQKFKGKAKKRGKKKKGSEGPNNAGGQARAEVQPGQRRDAARGDGSRGDGSRGDVSRGEGSRGDTPRGEGSRGEQRPSRNERTGGNAGQRDQQRGEQRNDRRGDPRGQGQQGQRRGQPRGAGQQGSNDQNELHTGQSDQEQTNPRAQGQRNQGRSDGQGNSGQSNQGRGNQPRHQQRNQPGNRGNNPNRGGNPRSERPNTERPGNERGNNDGEHPERGGRSNSGRNNSENEGDRPSKPDNQQ